MGGRTESLSGAPSVSFTRHSHVPKLVIRMLGLERQLLKKGVPIIASVRP